MMAFIRHNRFVSSIPAVLFTLASTEMSRNEEAHDPIAVEVAMEEHLPLIVNVTNEAYVADEFFKKPQYHQRFDHDTVLKMMKAEGSMFLLAFVPSEGERQVRGSMFLRWTMDKIDAPRNTLKVRAIQPLIFHEHILLKLTYKL